YLWHFLKNLVEGYEMGNIGEKFSNSIKKTKIQLNLNYLGLRALLVIIHYEPFMSQQYYEEKKSPENHVLPRISGILLLFPVCFKVRNIKKNTVISRHLGDVSKQINCMVKNKKCNCT